MELESAAVGFFQIADVVVGNILGLVAVDDDQRRVAAAGVGIAQLDAPPVDQGRRVIADRIFQNTGEVIGAELVGGGGIGLVYRLVEVANAAAVQRGDKV